MFVSMTLIAVLIGHTGWVTQLATTPGDPSLLISASQDKKMLVWRVGDDIHEYPLQSLEGHTHFVSDVAISANGKFAVSGSWDNTVRTWDIKTGENRFTLEGHTGAVLSVAVSPLAIASSSSDKTIKLWNNQGECLDTIQGGGEGHTDWVSAVRFDPDDVTKFMSGGYDTFVKRWGMASLQGDSFLMKNFTGHIGNVNSVAVSPDGSLCASGGQDAMIMVWSLRQGNHKTTLDARNTINALEFHPNPNLYVLAVAAGPIIQIWNVFTGEILHELSIPERVDVLPKLRCTSLAWSSDGQTLFAGYTDTKIRAFSVSFSSSGQ